MHPRQLRTIAMATALNALDGFDVLSISFASPGIASEWQVDYAALGLVLSMELIGMAAGAFLLGAIADRIGRRPTVIISLVIMACGMAAASLAQDVVVLSVIRLITGLGIGGMLATTNAVVAETANARKRNLAIAIMAGGYPVGAIIGGAVATQLLAATGHWQSIFLFGAVASASFLPLALWLIPETVAFLCERQPHNALERINHILIQQNRRPVAALPPRPERSRRVAITEAFAPEMARTTLALIAIYFAHIMTFYFLMKWIPKIVFDMGFVAATASGVLVWANVGGATGSLCLSLLTQRFDVRKLVIGAMLCGFVSVTLFGQDLGTLAALSLVAGLSGFFTNGATAGLYAVFAQAFPARLRAGGTGLVIGIGRGGAALGPIMAGALFSLGWPLKWVASVLACGTLVAAVILMRTRIAPGSPARGEA
jgi:benzoate transport